MRLIVCADCKQENKHQGRGLCGKCYWRRTRNGTLEDLPRVVPNASPGHVDEALRVGLTYRQLDYWTARGYLTADDQHPGTGRNRTWNDGELAVAAQMLRLTGAGLTVAAAARVARGDSELAPGIRVLVEETS